MRRLLESLRRRRLATEKRYAVLEGVLVDSRAKRVATYFGFADNGESAQPDRLGLEPR